MDIHTATEEAYKKGYEAGKRDAVRHGKWGHVRGRLCCSECGNCRTVKPGYEMYICDEHLKWVSMERSNFCPNCGAKMDFEI